MRLYFDGETQKMVHPALGQQIQIQEYQDQHSETEISLVEGQKVVMEKAITDFAEEIFVATKCQANAASAQFETKTDSSDENQDWKFRYVTQVASFIRRKNVYAVDVKGWQFSHAKVLLRTRAILPRLPKQHTLEVRHTCCTLCSTTQIIRRQSSQLLV